ncbi:hypothetical protein U6A24_16315 [Aquimarina gracilis]|uniref:Peptidase M1 membrane alanine aminopeptidase domain-containing protein n=1 Tax=Aquimarina gracilis TaxID=874422 RepID=A0ABU5ZYT4_9FLAO|nr:hypothetical protein [Aquimarina gracilis]MEB3347038.1 hypothetical protein [Aquimarina gracilis]
MKKRIYTFLIVVSIGLLSNAIVAQIHITGNIEINMNSGVFKCNVNLSNMPKLKDYSILLNKGMNIKYFKDYNNDLIKYEGHYNGQMKGEAIEYVLKIDSTSTFKEINVSYLGAFPVYTNDYNEFDYKGVIAINNQTVRATEQTKWYPVVYDITNDKLINSYTYDLNISLIDGNTIFLNGSPPKKKSNARFVSKKAYPLFLFAGTYDFIENNGDYILNTDVTQENAKVIFENIEVIKNNYSKNLGIKFTDHIYLINHKAINKRKKGSSWGFNTYPAFAFTGLNFNKLIDENGTFYNHHFRYFGHEFGHNYFGNNVASGKLKWFWVESFAEYLSYNTIEDLIEKNYLKEVLTKQLSYLKSDDIYVPLNEIESTNQIGEKYRYVLAPLMLKCFEDRFGRVKMNLVIRSLLQYAKDETLTIEHFQKSAIKSGIDKEDYKAFEKNFITSKNFKQNIIEEIKKKL